MKRSRDEPQQPPVQRQRPAPQQAFQGQQQQANPNQQQQKLTTNDALSYLREVKNRFADRKQVYDTFLDIMKEFKAQRIDTSGVIVRVKRLFKGHKELILGFNTFLPKGYEIELARSDTEEEDEAPPREQPPQPKQAVEFDQAINYVNKIKNRFAQDERVYKAFLEILNMYRKGQKNIHQVYQEVALLFQSHDDLLREFAYFLPDTSAQGTASAQMRQYMRQPGVPGSNVRAPGMGAQPTSRPVVRPGQAGVAANMPGSPGADHRMQHKRKAARRAEEVGGVKREAEDGGNAAGTSWRGLGRELQFLDKVKARLRSRELYGDFLKCLNLYSQDIITRQELVQLVADILGRTPDLMQQFHSFMSSCENMELDAAGAAGAAGKNQVLTNRDMLKARLQKDKFLTKPLSEVVANETERVTPSYVKIPPGYPRLHHSGRTALADKVINDQYVNVITGSEDYSFKLMRKNQYEEALFRCEDDRYEFDMSVEQNLSTIRVFRPVAERLAKMSPEERAAFTWNDMPRVNAVHFGHVQKLYGESGQQLVELLQKNPSVAVPVVLARMEAKDQEWRKVREEMIPVWRRIYEQNYPRSLDHRSFYWKQAEKKVMMAKVMVSEIKESADKRKADEAYLRGLCMAHRHVIPATEAAKPDLSYKYSERSVFEDVYQAVATATEHQVHAGLKEQVMLLYAHIIEPFLGLTERTEDIKRLRDQLEEEDGEEGDVDMGDAKSDDSDQQRGKSAGSKATPGMEGTPEPGEQDAEEEEGRMVPSRRSPMNSEDGKEGGKFSSCKPLMPYTGPASTSNNTGNETTAAASTSYGGWHGSSQSLILPQGTRLLFGNEAIYLFFRYHRYLYDRLCAARKFSLDIATKKIMQPSRGAMMLLQDSADGNRTPVPEPANESAIKDEADRIHGAFMNSLINMLATPQADIGIFEDQVRHLLGTNSYELFTLDKLLTKVVKQLQNMVTDDQSLKLWEMCKYEQLRSRAVSAELYHVNCHTVLEETCYRIQYTDTDNQLKFQMNDPDRSDSYLAPEGALPAHVAAYISSSSTYPAAEPKPEIVDNKLRMALFLRRSLPPMEGKDPEAALAEALGRVIIRNGLETKIACTSSKVSYVLDTEDLLVRKHRPFIRPYDAQGLRAVRMDQWLQRCLESAPIEAAGDTIVKDDAPMNDSEAAEVMAAVHRQMHEQENAMQE